MKLLIGMVAIGGIIILIDSLIYIYNDIKDYNKGVCPKCKTKLKLCEIDSNKNKEYICMKCGYTTWITYDVEKLFK